MPHDAVSTESEKWNTNMLQGQKPLALTSLLEKPPMLWNKLSLSQLAITVKDLMLVMDKKMWQRADLIYNLFSNT